MQPFGNGATLMGILMIGELITERSIIIKRWESTFHLSSMNEIFLPMRKSLKMRCIFNPDHVTEIEAAKKKVL